MRAAGAPAADEAPAAATASMRAAAGGCRGGDGSRGQLTDTAERQLHPSAAPEAAAPWQTGGRVYRPYTFAQHRHWKAVARVDVVVSRDHGFTSVDTDVVTVARVHAHASVVDDSHCNPSSVVDE
jgi:hypothetical protein